MPEAFTQPGASTLADLCTYFIPFQAELALRAEEALEKSLKVEIDAMAKDADRLDGLVARAQAAIDKRQNVIELRQQQLADLGGSFRQLN